MSYPSGKKLQEAIDDYVENYSRAELGLSNKTLKNKRNVLKRFQRFAGENPLSPNTIRKYSHHLAEIGLKSSSRRFYLRAIKAFINFLYKREYISKNFSNEIVTPKVLRKKLDIVPAEVAEKVILTATEPAENSNCVSKQSKHTQRIALRFVLRTGLRASELLKLKREDINPEEGVFTVQSKGGNIDVLPLPQDMVGELKNLKKGDSLFNIASETLNVALKRGSKELGVKPYLTLHTLRHIFCTTLLKSGVSLQVVSRLMRHSSVKITDSVYSHYNINDLKLALNSRHPLIRKSLSVPDVFSNIERKISNMKLKEDKRFVTNIERSSSEFTLRVKVV